MPYLPTCTSPDSAPPLNTPPTTPLTTPPATPAHGCAPNMKWKTSVLPCLPTCTSPDADSWIDCFENEIDTCACAEQGMVYVNATVGCIDAGECKCIDDYGVSHEVSGAEVRCAVCGVWCAVCGVRCLVCGVWCVSRGCVSLV